jgi:ABC-type sugar transport system substrate-binding protein
MSMLAERIPLKFGLGGHKVDVASAEGSPARQLEQIENFVTMGVDGIIVMAMDPTSLGDVLSRAQKKGVKVIAFSTKTPTYDVFIGADEFACGKEVAVMASEWIDKTFPTAKAGSVDVAIMEFRDVPDFAQRSDGLKEIVKLQPKAKLVKVVGVDRTTPGAQAAAENLFLTNRNIKAVICINADTAKGVDAYAMALNSAVKDKKTLGVFGHDWNDEVGAMIKLSRLNRSVLRGTIMLGKGLDAMFQEIYDYSLEPFSGKPHQKNHYGALTKVTAENIDQITAH